jgi:hypothetical protein
MSLVFSFNYVEKQLFVWVKTICIELGSRIGKNFHHRDKPPQRWGGPTPQIGSARASLASLGVLSLW